MSRSINPRVGSLVRTIKRVLHQSEGSAILEFAIALPLLVVFVVGIYDFSGAFNDKQKIEQAAQAGAIVAGAQPMNDIQSSTPSPQSLLPVVGAVFNSLVASGVVPGGACGPPGAVTQPAALTWQYQISGCSTGFGGDDKLTITINRGWVSPTGTSTNPAAVGTVVTVQYPYHWQFNSVIQLLIPGASYSAITNLTEIATVQNQL